MNKKRVLILHGGVGGTTFEILKNCKNLHIDHTDLTTD
jgi:spermidine synthase